MMKQVTIAVIAGGALFVVLRQSDPGGRPSVTWEPAARPEGLLREGVTAPEFAGILVRGEDTRLADYLGRTLVIVFVSTDCPFCRTLEERMAGLTIADGRAALLVSRGSPKNAQRIAAWTGSAAPVLADEDSSIARAYGAVRVPTAYLINEDGRIVRGAVGLDEVWEIVQAIGTVKPRNESAGSV